MSLSGSKSKTSGSQTSTAAQTNTQSLDPWSKAQYEQQSGGILGAVQSYNAQPYKAYTGPQVAGLTLAEQQARQLASANVGNASGILSDAEGIVRSASGAGPSTSQASKVSGILGYDPQQYAAPTLGNARTVATPALGDAKTFNAASMSGARVGNMDQIKNRLGEIPDYMNPELNAVVNTTLASYDEDAARQRAAMKAQAAGSGKFGGSRYGVAEGIYDADTSRNRAGTEAALRSNAYDRATGLLGTDVNSVNTGRLTQAQLDQQTQSQNAASENAARAANTSAANQFALQQGILGFNADTFNTGAANARDSERAQMAQQTGMFNAGAQNDAARYGADVANQGILANAGFEQQTNLANAQAQEQAYARQMQGAGILGDMAGQRAAIGAQEVQMLRQFGLDERAIQQAQIDAERASFDREAADRLQRLQLELQARSGILGATPNLINTSGTSNQTGTSTGSTSGSQWGVSAGFGPKGFSIGG